MKLASILNPALVFCHLSGNSREELYSNMLSAAAKQMRENVDVENFASEMMRREDDLQIPYSMGIALPHMRSAELHDLYILVGILDEPIKLKGNDADPVQIIIMSLISDSTSASYLKSLAAFSRYLMKPENLAGLVACNDGMAVLSKLAADNVLINKNITAEDLMTTKVPVIRIEDTLSQALDTFYREKVQVLPVVDSENRLVGQIDAVEVISSFIPEYIFMMENLNFLNSFEVFENIFKSEENLKVQDYVQPVKMILTSETPLIQFTIRLVRRESRAGFVVDKDNRLLGVVNIGNIVHKVLRG